MALENCAANSATVDEEEVGKITAPAGRQIVRTVFCSRVGGEVPVIVDILGGRVRRKCGKTAAIPGMTQCGFNTDGIVGGVDASGVLSTSNLPIIGRR